jgi:polysaccharide biosynthesis protein PslH
MKAAFVAFYEVFPPASGAASVSFHLFRLFPGEKMLIHLTRKPASRSIVNGMPVLGFQYSPDKKPAKLFSIFMRFFDICREIRIANPDVIILEGASWVGYHLALSGFLRMRGISCPIVYHSHNVEYLLRRERKHGLVPFLTKQAERALVRYASLVTAVSQVDASAFESLYGVKPLIVPNGVAMDQFQQNPVETARIKKKYGLAEKTALFMGLSDYPPNRDAINSLVLEIFPQVLIEVPDAQLVIIGGKTAHRREWLLNPGSLPYEDVPALISASLLCVAPIRSGSGTRIKILEYMAAGRPVVSTTKGAEGLDMTLGVHLWIADSQADFAKAMIHVFRDSARSEAMGDAARTRVRDLYSWEKIADRFSQEVQKFLAEMNTDPRSGGTNGVVIHE